MDELSELMKGKWTPNKMKDHAGGKPSWGTDDQDRVRLVQRSIKCIGAVGSQILVVESLNHHDT